MVQKISTSITKNVFVEKHDTLNTLIRKLSWNVIRYKFYRNRFFGNLLYEIWQRWYLLNLFQDKLTLIRLCYAKHQNVKSLIFIMIGLVCRKTSVKVHLVRINLIDKLARLACSTAVAKIVISLHWLSKNNKRKETVANQFSHLFIVYAGRYFNTFVISCWGEKSMIWKCCPYIYSELSVNFFSYWWAESYIVEFQWDFYKCFF